MTLGMFIFLVIWIAACTSKPETKQDDLFGLLDGRDRTGK